MKRKPKAQEATSRRKPRPSAPRSSRLPTPVPSLVAVTKPPADPAAEAEERATCALMPTVTASGTIRRFLKPFGEGEPLEGIATMGALTELVDRVVGKNNTRMLEAQLVVQAHSLDAIFNNLAQRAGGILDGGGDRAAFELYMRLALKAQSQCRTTIESLSVIKNPPSIAFVRQANISGGHQQVNNGNAIPGAREIGRPANELLEIKDGERLDVTPARATGGADPSVATVGAQHGTKDRKREGGV